jgi:hypothetical protein
MYPLRAINSLIPKTAHDAERMGGNDLARKQRSRKRGATEIFPQ